jgi:hypothetical protein
VEGRSSAGPQDSGTPAAPGQAAAADAVDKMPKTEAEWRAFAALSPAERSATYLRSIRSMILFFTVLTVIGLVLGLLLGFGVLHSTTATN